MTKLADGRSITDVAVIDQVTGGGGPVPYKLVSANSANATNVKDERARLYMAHGLNKNATAAYLKFYNKATAPDQNDTPVLVVMLPQNAPQTFAVDLGVLFDTGLGFRIVTGSGDSDNTSVGAGDVVVSLAYA